MAKDPAEPFMDTDFFADQSSLFAADATDLSEENKMLQHELSKINQWLRPHEVILTTDTFFTPELFSAYGVMPGQV